MPAKKINPLIVLLLLLTIQSFCQQTTMLAHSEGLAPARLETTKDVRGVLYGFVNKEGKFVIKPQFDTVVSGFRNGYAVVVKNTFHGVIDQRGNPVVPFIYTDVAPAKDKIFPVRNQEGLWGFYGANGKMEQECVYNNFRFDNDLIVAQKNGLWGALSSKGEVRIPFKYRELERVTGQKRYNAFLYNHWELSDSNHVKRGEFRYDSLAPAGKGVLKYYKIGKYGLVDLHNNPVTAYKYDSIGLEKNGRLVVRIWDKYGVIDINGNEVLKPVYEKILLDSLSIRGALKNKEGKIWWGLYSMSGAEVLPAIYPYIGETGEGLVPVRAENGIWRYLNTRGETVIPFRFSHAGPFYNGLAEVVDYQSGKRYMINPKGEEIISNDEIPFYRADLFWMDRNDHKIWRVTRASYDDFQLLKPNLIQVSKKGKVGLLSSDDQLIVPCKYDYVTEPSVDGFSAVRLGNKWGVVDRSGRYSMPLTEKFERIFPFYENYARVLIKGRYGFIDTKGNVYVSPQYPDAGNASEGMIAVKINNKWGFVNTDETLKVQPYYDQVWPFVNGCAIVYGKGKYNLVNKEGRELHAPSDGLKVTSTGKYLLEQSGRYGLTDEWGEELLPVRYEKIREVKGGYFIVNLRGLHGVLDRNGSIVIPITYDHIQYDSFNQLFICGTTHGQKAIRVDLHGREQ